MHTHIRMVFALLAGALLLSGCVTIGKTEMGKQFYPGKVTIALRQKLPTLLEKKVGDTFTEQDALRFFGAPEKTLTNRRFFALGWEHSVTEGKNFDFGVYRYSKSTKKARFMVLIFRKGTKELYDYRVVTKNVPTHAHGFSSRPLVQAGIMYVNYRILSNIINQALDRAVDRADHRLDDRIDDAQARLQKQLDKAHGKFQDQLDNAESSVRKQLDDFQSYLNNQWHKLKKELDDLNDSVKDVDNSPLNP